MESWSTEASASHVWAGRWSRPGIAGVGQGEARTASWGDPGPRPGQGHVLGSQAWPGSLETGPESPSGRLFLAVHPSRMPQSRGLPKPQMFGTLTLCVCVLHRELMWPRRWSWNRSDLCVVLGFHPCFQGEARGSSICSGLFVLVCSACGNLPSLRGFGEGWWWGRVQVLEGNLVRALGLKGFSA